MGKKEYCVDLTLCEFCIENKVKLEHLGFGYCVDCAEEALEETLDELADIQWQADELKRLIKENK